MSGNERRKKDSYHIPFLYLLIGLTCVGEGVWSESVLDIPECLPLSFPSVDDPSPKAESPSGDEQEEPTTRVCNGQRIEITIQITSFIHSLSLATPRGGRVNECVRSFITMEINLIK